MKPREKGEKERESDCVLSREPVVYKLSRVCAFNVTILIRDDDVMTRGKI